MVTIATTMTITITIATAATAAATLVKAGATALLFPLSSPGNRPPT
jgi:hypothetical protein